MSRVDSVKILKSGDPGFDRLSNGKDTVSCYDLTVSGHPSFFVGDGAFLAHNCVDQDSSNDYNDGIYQLLKIDDAMIEDAGDPLYLIDPPGSHAAFDKTWIGMDVGWCVDVETEILTKRGWLRYDELLVGDESLSIDPETGLSDWQRVTDIYSDTGLYTMTHIKGQTFDALTTRHHRWLTKHTSGKWRWKTTETLNTNDRIPYSVKRNSVTDDPIYEDDLVKLVAWIFCEGSFKGSGFEFSQSHIVNFNNVQDIKSLLTRLLGHPGKVSHGGLWNYCERFDGDDNYSSRYGGAMTYFWVMKEATEILGLRDIFLGKEKGIDPKFISCLSQAQLEDFIEVCNKADGWTNESGTRCFEQYSEVRSSSYQMICALAGYPISTSYSDTRGGRWHTAILKCSTVSPVRAAGFPRVSDQAMTIATDRKLRTIWCPTMANHQNWLARRNGSVYFTGNTTSPSAITVFAEEKNPDKSKESILRLISRILLTRVSGPDQVRIVAHLIDLYRPKAFAMDSTGAGQPLVQFLQEAVRDDPSLSHILDRIKGYNFSSNIVVDIDETKEIDQIEAMRADPSLKEMEVKRNVKEYSSDVLRELVDQGRLILPWDKDLIGEFQGETWGYSKKIIDHYGRRKIYSGTGVHSLDAARLGALAYKQQFIDEILANHKNQWEPSPLIFL